MNLWACDGGGAAGPGDDETAAGPHVRGDLQARIEGIQDAMPRRGSEGFVPPSEEVIDRWRTLVGALIEGDTAAVEAQIEEHFPSYALVRFTDAATEQRYYLLQETPSVEKGWGTVVVDPVPERDLLIEVPHPVYDLNTHREGIDAFQKTGARALLIAGTHRCANHEASPCEGTSGACDDGRYHISDVAHFVATPFQAAHETFTERFPETVALSLHGNGRESCEDVFLSNGVADATHASVEALQTELAERSVSVGVPGTSSCPLVGTTNVQGRFTNGSPHPCTDAVSSATGTFIHIEQRRAFREDAGAYGLLIEAIKAAFD